MMQPAAVPQQMAGPPPTLMDHHQYHQHQQAQQQPWMVVQAQPPQPPPPMWNPQAPQHPPPPPPPPQSHVAHQYSLPPPASADEVRTLWIGDLQYWMDENFILGCFAHTGEVVSVKLIRNKQTSQLEGYGFIEFANRATAERILQTYNGTMMPNTEQNFRLNWASFGMGEKRTDESPEFTIFVGDLAADVTDYILQEAFRASYPSVKGAKVVTDRITGRTKGYGFVRFGDESEQLRSMTEMNGMLCSTRPMRIGAATNKKIISAQQFPKTGNQYPQGTQNENDPTNTTVFVGGLDSTVTDDHLRQVFSKYGELVHVKIPPGKRCGFVQFADRSCAEEAIRMLNGIQLGGQSIRLSWGRSPAAKQAPQQDPNTWNGGPYYGYAQGYETYGYQAAPQDPSVFYQSYPGYGYQQPRQQQLQ